MSFELFQENFLIFFIFTLTMKNYKNLLTKMYQCGNTRRENTIKAARLKIVDYIAQNISELFKKNSESIVGIVPELY
jgi:hypothetical protein